MSGARPGNSLNTSSMRQKPNAYGWTPVALNSKVETDDVLGPLPDGWEKGETVDGRFYFVE